jgi:hypothetical protein
MGYSVRGEGLAQGRGRAEACSRSAVSLFQVTQEQGKVHVRASMQAANRTTLIPM